MCLIVYRLLGQVVCKVVVLVVATISEWVIHSSKFLGCTENFIILNTKLSIFLWFENFLYINVSKFFSVLCYFCFNTYFLHLYIFCIYQFNFRLQSPNLSSFLFKLWKTLCFLTFTKIKAIGKKSTNSHCLVNTL